MPSSMPSRGSLYTSSMKWVSVAYATAVPSWVLVPLPSSSRITRDLAVADFMISEASWRQRRTKVSYLLQIKRRAQT